MTVRDRWQDLTWRRWARDRQPILIGPWRSELGFESLYWLPWLTAWRQRYGIKKERLIVLSRGGAGHWYDAAKSVDLYDYVPAKQLREEALRDQMQTGSVKQQRFTAWEQKLVPLIAEGLGLRRYHLLHPSAMYRSLTPFWEGRTGLRLALERLAFAPIPVPALPLTIALPERFTVAHFYQRHTLPMTEDWRTAAANYVDAIAKRQPVVLLATGLHLDDHIDFPLKGPNIISLAPHMTPQNNLAIQTAVLARADRFVGTYGGAMQLAVRLGKPVVGFYHQNLNGTVYEHTTLTRWLGDQQHTSVFIGRPDDAQFLKEVLG